MIMIDAATRDAAADELARDRAELAAIALEMERSLEDIAAAINKVQHASLRMTRHLHAVGRLETSNDRMLQRFALIKEQA